MDLLEQVLAALENSGVAYVATVADINDDILTAKVL